MRLAGSATNKGSLPFLNIVPDIENEHMTIPNITASGWVSTCNVPIQINAVDDNNVSEGLHFVNVRHMVTAANGIAF